MLQLLHETFSCVRAMPAWTACGFQATRPASPLAGHALVCFGTYTALVLTWPKGSILSGGRHQLVAFSSCVTRTLARIFSEDFQWRFSVFSSFSQATCSKIWVYVANWCFYCCYLTFQNSFYLCGLSRMT